MPTVVKVRAFAGTERDGDAATTPPVAGQPASEGLGFVVEAEGIVLTTYRLLIDPADGQLHPSIEVAIPVPGGEAETRLPAVIVGLEPTLDLGILKIEPDAPLVPSKICERDRILPEQRVRALRGYREGVPDLVDGVITDLNSMECYQETITATMLKARIAIPDAAVGGPVFNDLGEVVGVFTGYIPRADDAHEETAGDDGKIHILPIFLVFNIYESIKLKQSLKSPWTGFSVRPLTESEQAKFPIGRFLGGIGIDYVWENSPAERLGIREGDFLVGFSYYPVKSVADFQKWLYLYGVGAQVKLHTIRDGADHRALDYLVEERPAWAKPR